MPSPAFVTCSTYSFADISLMSPKFADFCFSLISANLCCLWQIEDVKLTNHLPLSYDYEIDMIEEEAALRF